MSGRARMSMYVRRPDTMNDIGASVESTVAESAPARRARARALRSPSGPPSVTRAPMMPMPPSPCSLRVLPSFIVMSSTELSRPP